MVYAFMPCATWIDVLNWLAQRKFRRCESDEAEAVLFQYGSPSLNRWNIFIGSQKGIAEFGCVETKFYYKKS